MEKYRGMKLKLTPQRLAILEYLEGNKDHPSAEDIYTGVSKRYPTMAFATVYNTLEALKRRGYIRELTIDPNKKRFDPNPKHHHHLMCVTCKKTVDILGEIKIPLPTKENKGFEIIGHHIEFYGLCSKCKGSPSAFEASLLSQWNQEHKGDSSGSPRRRG
jgi:Fur family transcriptional regulator, peroxide stress response regulator